MQTEIMNSQLGPEIKSVLETDMPNIKNCQYRAILHTADLNMEVDRILSVDVFSDFVENFGEKIFISFLFPHGDFVKFVLPEQANLEVSLINMLGNKETTVKYKFIISNHEKSLAEKDLKQTSASELNSQSLAIVKGQCLDRFLEVFRTRYTFGAYKEKALVDVMTTVLRSEIDKVEIVDYPVKEMRISIIPPNNNRIYRTIVVPSRTKATGLPTELQEQYGVYNAGIGTFLQMIEEEPDIYFPYLFVYPLYDFGKIGTTPKKLIIIGVSTLVYQGIDKTVLVDGDIVKILSTPSDGGLNTKVKKSKNLGSGYRALESDSVLTRTQKKEGNKVYVDRDEYRVDVVSELQEDDVDFRPDAGVTNNHYDIKSDTLRQQGDTLLVTWRFSKPEMLFPGMSVLYVYETKEGEVIQTTGQLLGLHSTTDNNSKFRQSVLNLFLGGA